MTPAMFDRIAERKLAAQLREDLLFGILNATVANYSFCSPEVPRQPADFMLRPPEKKPPQIITPQEQADHVRHKLERIFGSPQQPLMIGDERSVTPSW